MHHCSKRSGILASVLVCMMCAPIGCASKAGSSKGLAGSGSDASGSNGFQTEVLANDDPTSRISRVRLSTDAIEVRPDWVVNPAMGGVLGAVGVSSMNDLGTRFQIEDARYSARLEIARMLETRIQSAGRDLTEQRIRATRENDDDPKANNDSTHSKIGIDRRITDVVLSGSRQRALWFDPMNRDLYVWVVMDGGILEAVSHTVSDDVSIFVAIQKIVKEYIPPRPEIVVDIENAPETPALPPLSPAEQLEDFLKTLESQPINRGDTEYLDESGSPVSRPVEPGLLEEIGG